MPVVKLGTDITTVDTTQNYPLGLMYERQDPTENQGMQVWIYVQMTGAAAVQGSVLSRTATGLTRTVVKAPVGSNAAIVVGVAQHAIAEDSYGWILREGLGEVLAGTGTIDVSEAIAVDDTDLGTAREFGAYATTDASTAGTVDSFGYATENAAGAALATCWVSCRG